MTINNKNGVDGGSNPPTSTIDASANQYIYAEYPWSPSDGLDSGLQTAVVGCIYDGGVTGNRYTWNRAVRD